MVRLVLVGVVVAVFGAIGAARGLTAIAEEHQAAQAQPVAAAAQVAPAPVAEPLESGEASIAKSRDGHFWADAQVDGHQLHFLIDTGATAVALTSDDARQLGIDPSSLTYSYTVQTANGPAKAAEVKLRDVAVGRAEVSDVDAFVIDHGLETSLLGMSYLGRLSKFEATPDALVLRS
jgi:aspartyl protease family protein